jgi:DNA polymerase-3 subunit alpha
MNFNMTSFVHLHVHSEYSLLDGCARIPLLVAKARELGYESLAVTDHGGVYGLIPFYREAIRAGIRPILGAELYLEPGSIGESPYHLPLLARDEEGYRNLLRLATLGHLDGFCRKPMIRWEWLVQHAQGLIALSGCLQGEIPRLILEGREAKAEQRLNEYLDLFGKDGFYLELQRHGLPEEERVISGSLNLAKKTGCRSVATNDVHYLEKKDARAHDLLLAVQTLSLVNQPDRLRLAKAEYDLKSITAMKRRFADYPWALAQANEIADSCRVQLEFGRLRLPEFPLPLGLTAEEYLRGLAEEGLKRRLGNPGTFAVERLSYELDVIFKMGLTAYFLIVADIVQFAKQEGIPVGPGRGSGVGSLTAYVLGITEINPLDYGLLFERFLNPERRGMPDLDIDLCHRGRPRVLEYVRRKYGRDHVAHLGAFVTLRPRAVVRDVGRALGVSYDKVNQLAKAVPFFSSSIDKALEESERLSKMSLDPEIQKVLEYSRALSGLPRHMTQHAAGIVISQEPLTDCLALQQAGGEEIITQAGMETVEDLGLLKIDLLGLRYLTVINDTLDLLRRDGVDLSVAEIPLNDSQTYKALGNGDTVGTFQLESGGMRRLLRRYKPEHLQDIVAILALYRPGPLGSGMVETFIRRRHGLEKSETLHPLLEKVLGETYGVILYQEQVMEVARVLAGYTLGQADLLRRAVSRRDPVALAKERSNFLTRAQRLGVEPAIAEIVFDCIQEFGHYGFAKSHSAAYALTAYRTVYLKTHFPLAYYAALLTLNLGVEDRFPRYLAEIRYKGIKILTPDLNHSTTEFVPNGNGIRASLKMVKDLGDKGIQALLEARKSGGPFLSLDDLLHRTARRTLTKKALENLIRVGACGSFGIPRPQLLFELRRAWERSKKREVPDQPRLFTSEMLIDSETVFLLEYPETVQLELEKEILGNYLSKHPLEMIEDKLCMLKLDYAEELTEKEKDKVLLCGLINGVRLHRTRRGERMLFAVFEDLTGLMDLVVFPNVMREYGRLLTEKEPILVWGHTDTSDEQTSVIVEGVRRAQPNFTEG